MTGESKISVFILHWIAGGNGSVVLVNVCWINTGIVSNDFKTILERAEKKWPFFTFQKILYFPEYLIPVSLKECNKLVCRSN